MARRMANGRWREEWQELKDSKLESTWTAHNNLKIRKQQQAICASKSFVHPFANFNPSQTFIHLMHYR